MIENTRFRNFGTKGRFGKTLTLVPLQFEDVLAILSQYDPKQGSRKSGNGQSKKDDENRK